MTQLRPCTCGTLYPESSAANGCPCCGRPGAAIREMIMCARCNRLLPMEDAQRVSLPDPSEPWAAPNPADPQVYLLVCPECLGAA